MRNKPKIFLTGLFFILLVLIILVVWSLQPKPTPQESVTIRPSSQSALSACDLELQKRAVKDARIDLTNLGISTCYKLEITLDHAQNQLEGIAEVTYANLTGKPIPDLVFRLYPNSKLIYGGSITLSEMLVDGVTATFELFADNTAIRIPLLIALQPDQSVLVKMRFKVRPPQDFASDRVYGIHNYSVVDSTYLLANFFPILATRNFDNWIVHPVDGIGDAVTSDVALFSVLVRTPSEWEVVSTGVSVERLIEPTATSHRIVSGPTRDFMLVLAPNLVNHSQTIEGIKVNQWLPPSVDGGWQRALEIAAQSIQTFTSLYGEYPYTEFDIIAAPLQLAIGVEYPGLILIADKEYKPTQDAQNEQTVVIAHEVAHQWWYSTVGNDVTLNPWQDEGLTTYSTLVVLNKFYPPIANYLVDSYQQRISALEQSGGKERIAQSTTLFTTRSAAYSTVAYAKAALFFRHLETKLGLQTLSKALSTYYQRYAFQVAQPENLLSTIENTCACDLKSTYSDWGVR